MVMAIPHKRRKSPSRGAYGPQRHDLVVELGKLLKDIREEQGLTTRGVADAAKVPQSTIIRYEQGEREPRIFNLVRIATALGAIDRFSDFLRNSSGKIDSR